MFVVVVTASRVSGAALGHHQSCQVFPQVPSLAHTIFEQDLLHREEGAAHGVWGHAGQQHQDQAVSG